MTLSRKTLIKELLVMMNIKLEKNLKKNNECPIIL